MSSTSVVVVWVLRERRNAAELAFAVVDGIVREVYAIEEWHPAGTTAHHCRMIDLDRYAGGWNLSGRLAPDDVRDKDIIRSVAHLLSRGAADPRSVRALRTLIESDDEH